MFCVIDLLFIDGRTGVLFIDVLHQILTLYCIVCLCNFITAVPRGPQGRARYFASMYCMLSLSYTIAGRARDAAGHDAAGEFLPRGPLGSRNSPPSQLRC
jgi:hypothetical protein